jgi:hypothetical protein
MDATVAAGWIGAGAGLVGALVGAGGALLGGWLQHRQQEQSAKRERQEVYARSAAEATLNHLLQLHRSIAAVLAQWDVGGDNSRWRDARQPHLREFEMSLYLIPNAELRSRLGEVLTLVYDVETDRDSPGGGQPDAVARSMEQLDQVALTVAISQEGIDLVAAGLRGESLPARSTAFVATWNDIHQRAGENTEANSA